jgi:hypothetical protein
LCRIDPHGSDNDVCGDANDCYACSSPGGGGTAGKALPYGGKVDGTLSSKNDQATFTFVAEKGWNVGLVVNDGPGKPNPPFAVFPSFAAHMVVTFDGKTVLDRTGDIRTTGNAIGNLNAPDSGTYTLVVSAAETDGVSPLKYTVSLSPPDLVCKTNADCQVTVEGKTTDTGLTCQKSAFPDEDGPGKSCVPR